MNKEDFIKRFKCAPTGVTTVKIDDNLMICQIDQAWKWIEKYATEARIDELKRFETTRWVKGFVAKQMSSSEYIINRIKGLRNDELL